MHKPSSLPRNQRITTIGAVIQAQVMVPDWMRQMQQQYGDDCTVSASYVDTAFGTYCVGMVVVEQLTDSVYAEPMYPSDPQ